MQYALVDNQYQLVHGADILDVMYEVAICYTADPMGVVLLKHGEPQRIQDYREMAVSLFRDHGFSAMADSIEFIQGRFDTDTLNTIILSNHALGKFLARKDQQAA